MGRLLKLLVFLILLAAIAVVGYAYLGDLQPDRAEVTQPIDLDAE
ncbi:MAG: hypothetical protein ABJ327_10220 [Litoreibacter sp.]